MARIRKFVCYRSVERPYTRFSKYKERNFVRARPGCRVVRFDQGEVQKQFPIALHLIAKCDLQIRDHALESARQTMTRYLEKELGKTGYHLQIRCYPHHVLRENPLASGAGADRLSTGMAHSFGKPIGVAAQIYKGKPMITIRTESKNIPHARMALNRARYKLPCACTILTEDLQPKKQSIASKATKPKAVAKVKAEAAA